MISLITSAAEREKISKDLRTYCELDTYAMYQLWKHLSPGTEAEGEHVFPDLGV
jgi:hypothetical protein